MKKRLFLYCISLFILFILLQSIHATAVNAAEDKNVPIVEEIKILTPEVAPGGKVKIQVTVSDNVSGASQLSLMFYSPNKASTAHLNVDIEESAPLTGTYILETDINKYAELGVWNLALIIVQDYANNSEWIHSHLPENTITHNVSFNVSLDAPIEKEIEIDDGFTAWESKTNVPLNKEFTILFNTNIDISTIFQKNIHVVDGNGNNVPLMFIIDRGTDLLTSQVTIAPVGIYRVDSTYTLYIKDIYSKTGKKLTYNTKMKFTTIK